MSKKLKKKGFHKSIQVYFSRLKKMSSSLGHLSATPTSSSSGLFYACKYPKTPSFAANRAGDENDVAATLSDVDHFLHKNFRSLYRRGGNARNDDFSSDEELSGTFTEDVGVRTSGRSDSLSSPAASPDSSGGAAAVPGGGVAVVTISKDPCEEFRRSMQEMMDARHAEPPRALDWDFMEELLFSHLELNNRDVHKYILRAFTDLTVSFRLKEEEERRRRVPSRRRRPVGAESVPVGRRPIPANH